MVVFRSLVIPLQAAVMNLLSIGAAMGVVVAVFQYGWLGSLFGIAGGPIAAFLPVMVFAIVLGHSCSRTNGFVEIGLPAVVLERDG